MFTSWKVGQKERMRLGAEWEGRARWGGNTWLDTQEAKWAETRQGKGYLW